MNFKTASVLFLALTTSLFVTTECLLNSGSRFRKSEDGLQTRNAPVKGKRLSVETGVNIMRDGDVLDYDQHLINMITVHVDKKEDNDELFTTYGKQLSSKDAMKNERKRRSVQLDKESDYWEFDKSDLNGDASAVDNDNFNLNINRLYNDENIDVKSEDREKRAENAEGYNLVGDQRIALSDKESDIKLDAILDNHMSRVKSNRQKRSLHVNQRVKRMGNETAPMMPSHERNMEKPMNSTGSNMGSGHKPMNTMNSAGGMNKIGVWVYGLTFGWIVKMLSRR